MWSKEGYALTRVDAGARRPAGVCSSSGHRRYCSDIAIVHTPCRAPNANASAERWIRSAREECLNHLLTFREAHLSRVLAEYAVYFTQARAHQGLDQGIRGAPGPLPEHGPMRRRYVLGGLLHNYYRTAAKHARCQIAYLRKSFT